MAKPEVLNGLKQLLAESYTLYLKTHNYHWNVTGPMFTSLHTLFEVEYNELALAVDTIAERIRTLGDKAPASYTAFAELSGIKEENGEPNATAMIEQLVSDQAHIAATATALLKAAAEAGDEATVSIATDRIEVHEKNAWMLRSHLE